MQLFHEEDSIFKCKGTNQFMVKSVSPSNQYVNFIICNVLDYSSDIEVRLYKSTNQNSRFYKFIKELLKQDLTENALVNLETEVLIGKKFICLDIDNLTRQALFL